MDKETANYIRNYFPNLMTDDEKLALKHHMYTYKIDNSISDSPSMRKILTEKGLIRTEDNILDFLKDGYEDFELNVAKRIMTEMPEKVFLNNCPQCNKLARTPFARQCRFCGHNWHDLTVGEFKLNSSFQPTGSHFFLLGQIIKGEIKHGYFVDLTMLGLNVKTEIKAIEFVLKREDGTTWEEIAIGTDELTEEEKEYISGIGSFGAPFDIIKER